MDKRTGQSAIERVKTAIGDGELHSALMASTIITLFAVLALILR